MDISTSNKPNLQPIRVKFFNSLGHFGDTRYVSSTILKISPPNTYVEVSSKTNVINGARGETNWQPRRDAHLLRYGYSV